MTYDDLFNHPVSIEEWEEIQRTVPNIVIKHKKIGHSDRGGHYATDAELTRILMHRMQQLANKLEELYEKLYGPAREVGIYVSQTVREGGDIQRLNDKIFNVENAD